MRMFKQELKAKVRIELMRLGAEIKDLKTLIKEAI